MKSMRADERTFRRRRANLCVGDRPNTSKYDAYYCNGSGSRSSSTLRLPQHTLFWSLITSPDSTFVCTRFPGPLPYINPLCTRRCLKHSPRAIADYCPVFCRSVFSCAPTNLPYWAVVGVTYFDISSHCSLTRTTNSNSLQLSASLSTTDCRPWILAV